jgi:hypothetical protein
MTAEVSVHPDLAGTEDDALGFELFAQRRGQFADLGQVSQQAKHIETVT